MPTRVTNNLLVIYGIGQPVNIEYLNAKKKNLFKKFN